MIFCIKVCHPVWQQELVEVIEKPLVVVVNFITFIILQSKCIMIYLQL